MFKRVLSALVFSFGLKNIDHLLRKQIFEVTFPVSKVVLMGMLTKNICIVQISYWILMRCVIANGERTMVQPTIDIWGTPICLPPPNFSISARIKCF